MNTPDVDIIKTDIEKKLNSALMSSIYKNEVSRELSEDEKIRKTREEMYILIQEISSTYCINEEHFHKKQRKNGTQGSPSRPAWEKAWHTCEPAVYLIYKNELLENKVHKYTSMISLISLGVSMLALFLVEGSEKAHLLNSSVMLASLLVITVMPSIYGYIYRIKETRKSSQEMNRITHILLNNIRCNNE